MPANVLEIPSLGNANPIAPPSRERVLRSDPRASHASMPTARSMVPFGNQDCCPCPGQEGFRPGRQRPLSPGRGQPSTPQPLGQPRGPEKPFQFTPRTMEDLCDEQLKRLGIDKDCLKQLMKGMRPAKKATKRRKSTRSVSSKRKASTRKRTKSRRRDIPDDSFFGPLPPGSRLRGTKTKVRRGGPAFTIGGRYQWFQGRGKRGLCRDVTTNKIVKRSNCGR